MENFVKAANGYRGEVEIEGANLNAEVVEDTARSAIASGNEVGATIKRERRSRAEPITSKSYPEIIRDVNFNPDDVESISKVLERVRQRYGEVRRREEKANADNRNN